MKSTPTPTEPDDPLRAFCAEPDDDAWLARIARAQRRAQLGRIGPYRLLAAMRGGQGLVYRATRDDGGPDVALKRLADGAFADLAAQRRFEREIDAALELRHPRIVPVRHAEEIEGRLVLSMDWIDGLPLDRWVEREIPDRDPKRVVALVLDLFDAVTYAHQRGVLHRDLKPSNVLVDRDGVPRLLDFGLARRLGGEEETFTAPGQFLGTPAFAAPEQLEGARDVDVRADVYSLGVILFQLLRGALPDARLPPRGFEQAPRGDLERIVDKALRPDRSERYGSVAAFADDLRRFLAGEPMAADALDAWRRWRRLARRHRLVAGILLVAVIASLAFVVGRERSRARLDEEQRRTEAALAQARDRQQQAAQTLVFFIHDILDRANPLFAPHGLTVQDALAATEMRLDTLDTFTPMSRLILRESLASIYRSLDDLERAERNQREAVRIDAEMHGDAPPFGLGRKAALARILYEQGRLGEAAALLDGMLAYCDPPPGEPRAYVDSVLGVLGGFALARGRPAEALDLLERARASYRDVFGEDIPWFDDLWRSEALALLELGRIEEAETLLRGILARPEDGPVAPGYPRARQRAALAMVLRARGALADAEEQARAAVAELRVDLAPGHAHLADAMLDLASILFDRGRLGEARELADEVESRIVQARPGMRAKLVLLRARLESTGAAPESAAGG